MYNDSSNKKTSWWKTQVKVCHKNCSKDDVPFLKTAGEVSFEDLTYNKFLTLPRVTLRKHYGRNGIFTKAGWIQ